MNTQKLRSLAYIHSSPAFISDQGQSNCNSTTDVLIKRSKRNLVKWCSGCSTKINLCTCWQSTNISNSSHVTLHNSCLSTPRQSPLKDLDISSGTFPVGSPAARKLSLEAENLCVVLQDAQSIVSGHKEFKLPNCASDSCLLLNNASEDLTSRTCLLGDFSYAKSAGLSPFSATPSGLGDTFESQSVAESSTTGAGSQTTSSIICNWYNCDREIACCLTAGEDDRELLLLDHLMTMHVKPQCSRRRKYFVCQWTDCRVYRKPSLSYGWLERHVLSHCGTKSKPFKCIFDCPLRFTTRKLLEKHVRSHLPPSPNKIIVSHGNIHPQKGFTDQKVSTSAAAIIPKRKRRRKKIRGFRVRSVDFYDRRTQAYIKNRVMLASLRIQRAQSESSSTESLTSSTPSTSPLRRSSSIVSSNGTNCSEEHDDFVDISGETRRLLTFPYSVIGKRTLPNRSPQFLIKWCSQETFYPDEWVSQSDLTTAKILGAPRSKGRKSAALRAFHISLPTHTMG